MAYISQSVIERLKKRLICKFPLYFNLVKITLAMLTIQVYPRGQLGSSSIRKRSRTLQHNINNRKYIDTFIPNKIAKPAYNYNLFTHASIQKWHLGAVETLRIAHAHPPVKAVRWREG